MEREALKLALEALKIWEQMYPKSSASPYRTPAITAIKEALAQPAQEPVALVIDGVLVKSALPEKYTGHLYTAPPQREWVGLTDEEINKCAEAQDPIWIAKNVEAKLKEKNA